MRDCWAGLARLGLCGQIARLPQPRRVRGAQPGHSRGLQPGCPPAPPRAPQGLMVSLKRQAGPGPAPLPAAIYGGICLSEGFITAVKEPSVCRGAGQGGSALPSSPVMGSLFLAPSDGAVGQRMRWDAAAACAARRCPCPCAGSAGGPRSVGAPRGQPSLQRHQGRGTGFLGVRRCRAAQSPGASRV